MRGNRVSEELKTCLQYNDTGRTEKWCYEIRKRNSNMAGRFELCSDDLNMYEADFLYSTTDFITGYHIIKHCGVVFGDARFIPVTSFESFFTEGIVSARTRALEEIKENAERLGANAIINLRSENNSVKDVIHISLYGTAVKIITEEDYQAKSQKEERNSNTTASEKKINLRKDETAFLDIIASLDSFVDIWEAWEASGLGNRYEDLNNRLKAAKSSERMYGKMPGEVKLLKAEMERAMAGD